MRAVVVAAHGDGFVDLELAGPPACAACSGVCFWSRLKATRLPHIAAQSRPEAGAEVMLSLPERNILLGALLVHGVPWLSLMVGAGVGMLATGSDLGSLVGALLAVLAALKLLPLLRERVERATLAELRVEPIV